MRQWAVVSALSAGLAFCAAADGGGKRVLILALRLLVLMAELFNTAIEDLVDTVFCCIAPGAKDCGLRRRGAGLAGKGRGLRRGSGQLNADRSTCTGEYAMPAGSVSSGQDAILDCR